MIISFPVDDLSSSTVPISCVNRLELGHVTSGDVIVFLENFGRRLRDRRELKQLRQGDIASALQVTPQAVSKWERGENAPDIVLLPLLAQVLGVTTDWLLGIQEPEGDEFEATVFVSSILGFTARCETLSAQEISIWSNGFLHQVTDAVLQHGGVPIKYMGDGFLAFFAGRDHHQRAIGASVTARDVMADRVVIGLAIGRIHMATIGPDGYARPDILGPTVNRAFRVNGWAAGNAQSRIATTVPSGGGIAGAFEVSSPIDVSLKGLPDPLSISEVLGSRSSD